MNQKALLEIIKRLDKPFFKPRWDRYWHEHKNGDTPKFMMNYKYYRLNGEFIEPKHPMEYYNLWRETIKNYLSEFVTRDDYVHEFGCGSGINIDIVKNEIGSTVIGYDKYNKIFKYFDMLKPLGSIEPNAVILTVNSIEQLGNKYEPFIRWCVKQKPRLVIHIEPIYEFYDENNLVDYLTMKYHRIRGYPIGFLTYLRNKSDIKIVEERKNSVGSLFHQGGNLVAWKPI